jgi:hypothetical protein
LILKIHKLKKLFLLAAFITFINYTTGQELNCQVQISTAQVSGTDRKIYDQLKTAITEFMNNRKWTNETFRNEERIDCSILINITERIAADEFSATLQIQARRPVFSATYNSIMINHNDNDVHFKYGENTVLEFFETTYSSNLTSILGYYAYLVIGLDYDSFSLNGGTPYFQKALAINNNAQGSDEKGWKAFDGDKARSRYWIINNMLDAPFVTLRQTMYNYHRKGLDVMQQNPEEGRKVIAESIQALTKVNNIKQLSFSLQFFFNAKADEIVNIFAVPMSKQEDKDQKAALVETLNIIDPSRINKYQKISNTN